MQFDDFIYDLIFLLAPYLRVIRKMWSKKCIVYSDQIDSVKYYILVLQEDNLIYFDFLQNVFMCCHVTCSSNINPKHCVCVFGGRGERGGGFPNYSKVYIFCYLLSFRSKNYYFCFIHIQWDPVCSKPVYSQF